MLSFFRSASKSKAGTFIMGGIMLATVVGFGMADLSNVGGGSLGFGSSSSALAEVGRQSVTERDMSDAMQRRLQQVRQQNPEADYAAIAKDFDAMLAAMVDERALVEFSRKYGFPLSKRLIDAEIAQIPQARGLNGQFSDNAYRAFLAQQRLTDGEIRQLIASDMLQRLLLAPVSANTRVPVGVARPYASMLLEAREGQAATIPIELFRAGLTPSDTDLQRFYAANRGRYIVPEQRSVRIARIGPEQVANVTPSDQEIAAYYNANQSTYGANESRVLSQAVVPDQATANQIAARAKAGASLAAAAAPAGGNAAVATLDPQTRQAYAAIAGAKVAAAAFSAPSGAIVGPIQSDFGWVVAKVESVERAGGKSLAEARAEIAAKLTADKRQQALEELVDRVQTAVDDGSNFVEAAAEAKLQVTATPLMLANGTSRTDAAYRVPAELAPAIKAAFEIAPNDPPEVVSLKEQGYALVAPQEVVPAAPAPLASIRDRVARDWVNQQALARARSAAEAIAAKAARGMPLPDAVRQATVSLPAVRPLVARRLDIATATQEVPAPIRTLFTLAEGKSQMVTDAQGRGFFVVKVNKIVPGNATLQPGLISRMQNELQTPMAQDYAAQFLAAVRADAKIEQNEKAIAAQKQRLRSGTN
jgi:peptidyl-prolyl cis-trans isomerase D